MNGSGDIAGPVRFWVMDPCKQEVRLRPAFSKLRSILLAAPGEHLTHDGESSLEMSVPRCET